MPAMYILELHTSNCELVFDNCFLQLNIYYTWFIVEFLANLQGTCTFCLLETPEIIILKLFNFF